MLSYFTHKLSTTSTTVNYLNSKLYFVIKLYSKLNSAVFSCCCLFRQTS